MSDTVNGAELEAFLDEALPPEQMAALERRLRAGDTHLTARLKEINGRRDAGLHSLGGVWRERRLTCPTREQLGSYLLGALEDGHADYIRFHVEEAQCRICQASLEDLQAQQRRAGAPGPDTRQQRYFQSSVGRLSPGNEPQASG